MLINLDILEVNEILWQGKKYEIQNLTVTHYAEYVKMLESKKQLTGLDLALFFQKISRVNINVRKMNLLQLGAFNSGMTDILLGNIKKKVVE